MDAPTLQAKIYAGYAQVAERVGYAYDVFRSTGMAEPLAPANKAVAGLMVALNQRGGFALPNTYGKPLWWCFLDATQTRVGDYLVGRMGTFFIASQQDLLPVQLVECNRTLSFYRPAQTGGFGLAGYGGEVDADDTALLLEWPASVLQGSKGEKNEAGLPLDVKSPWWACLLPAVVGVALELGDRVADDLGNRYFVHQVELGSLGYRLKLMQVMA